MIGVIVLNIILLIAAIAITISYFYYEIKYGIIALVISVIIMAGIIAGEIWYFNNTAVGTRAKKSIKSNLENGIERSVKVYDVEGDLIQQYDGKFDLTYDSDRILFDDENGKRHIIYYTTGTVIIDEK